MKNWTVKQAKNISEFVYKHLEQGSGAMILMTSMLGIAMSSVAQTFAILLNDKYSISQKAFMAPQELTEGCITVLSMFLITKPIQKLTKQYTKMGKILSKDLVKYAEKNGLLSKRGKFDFDFAESIKSIIKGVENSDKFIRSSEADKTKMLSEHKDALHSFQSLEDSTSAITTTAGSILSTALISPLLRNYSASYYQKINMDYYNNLPKGDDGKPKTRYHKTFKSNYIFSDNPCKI